MLYISGCHVFEKVGFEHFDKKDRYVQYLAKMCEVVTDLDRDWLNQTDVTIRLRVKNRREFQNCHIGFQDDG